MARPVVLDCDTGTDDAVAVVLAALQPALDLLGVTTVAGNAPLPVTTDNTLRVLDAGRGDVPVHAGRAEPLVAAPPLPAGEGGAARGSSGGALPLPPAIGRARSESAVDWLVATVAASPRPVSLVATGPLTNLAAALEVAPTLVDGVDQLVVMGGAHARGNVTASAERNMRHDAAAAQRVLDAGFRRLTLVTADAALSAPLDRAHARSLRELGTAAGSVVADLVEQRIDAYARPGSAAGEAAPVHDPLAVAVLLDAGVLRTREAHVAVEQHGLLTYGRTVIDVDGVEGRAANALVALEADAAAYASLLRSTFAAR